jgi:hypothetical protein
VYVRVRMCVCVCVCVSVYVYVYVYVCVCVLDRHAITVFYSPYPTLFLSFFYPGRGLHL